MPPADQARSHPSTFHFMPSGSFCPIPCMWLTCVMCLTCAFGVRGVGGSGSPHLSRDPAAAEQQAGPHAQPARRQRGRIQLEDPQARGPYEVSARAWRAGVWERFVARFPWSPFPSCQHDLTHTHTRAHTDVRRRTQTHTNTHTHTHHDETHVLSCGRMVVACRAGGGTLPRRFAEVASRPSCAGWRSPPPSSGAAIRTAAPCPRCLCMRCCTCCTSTWGRRRTCGCCWTSWSHGPRAKVSRAHAHVCE